VAAEPPPPPPAPVVAEKAAAEEAPAKVEEAPKAPAEAPEKAEKVEPAKAEKAEKSEKTAKSEKPEKVSKPVASDDAPAKAKKPAAPPIVAVTFKTEPDGARMTAPNRAYGTTPEVLKLPPGSEHELTFTKAGYAPATKHYVVPSAGKGPQTVRISLKKLPEPKKAPAPPPAPPKKGWFSR
jgi:hypothetical protein